MEYDMEGGLRGIEEEERGLLECSVCGARSTTGLHYGATTCYPCRAFFRRIPERKRPPRCKRQGTCSVEALVSKHCPGCRFQKCLRAGMQLCQVLTGEQRRERFASSMRRKRAAEESRVESDSSPVEEQNFSPVGEHNFSPVEEQTSRLVTTGWQEEELLRQGEAVQGRLLEEREQGEPGHVTGQQDPVNYDHQLNRQEPQFHKLERGSSPRPRLGVPMPDTAPLNITQMPRFFQQADLNWNSSLVKPWPLLHPFAGPSPPVAKLARIETSRAPHNFSTPENLAGSYRGIHQPFDFSLNNYKNLPQPQPAPKIKPDQASMGRPDGVFENRLFPEAEPRKRPSVIQKFGKVHLQYNEVSSILAKVPPGKKFDESGLGGPDQPVAAFVAKDEDPEDIRMINKYLHKKFDRSMLQCFESEEPSRSSVIVKPSTSKATRPADSKQIILPAKQKVDLDENLVDIYDEIEISDKDLEDIKAFCLTTCPQLEDAATMKARERSFYDTWFATNVGEKLMNSFVDFARNGSQLSYSFEIMKAKQYKERYVSCVCTMDLTDGLGKDVLLRVLRERIEMTGLLTWLTIFNLEPHQVPHFVLSQADKRQWMETAGDVQWPTSNKVLQFLPGSAETKLEIMKHMQKHDAAALADRSVHMLLSLISLFDSEDKDEHVRNFHGTVLGLLRGHIYKTCQNPQFHLEKVMESVKSLPVLAALRQKLLTEAATAHLCQGSDNPTGGSGRSSSEGSRG